MFFKNRRNFKDDPTLLQCLLTDITANTINGLGDVLRYAVDFAETLEKVKAHLIWKEEMKVKNGQQDV